MQAKNYVGEILCRRNILLAKCYACSIFDMYIYINFDYGGGAVISIIRYNLQFIQTQCLNIISRLTIIGYNQSFFDKISPYLTIIG